MAGVKITPSWKFVLWLSLGVIFVSIPLAMGLAWCFMQFTVWVIEDHSHLRLLTFTWVAGVATGWMIGHRPRRTK